MELSEIIIENDNKTNIEKKVSINNYLDFKDKNRAKTSAEPPGGRQI